jgi:hypothetical protein
MIRASEWCAFAADAYFRERHPNWLLAEEFGDVIFFGAVVFVHRARAEHIVRLLEAALALPARTGVGGTGVTPSQLQSLVARRSLCWRDLWGWLGIVAGAAVFVAALAVPLNDAALLLALGLKLRGGRLILDALDLPRGGPW